MDKITKLIEIKLEGPGRPKKGNKYEKEVRQIFYQNWEIMRKEMEDNIDAIHKWYWNNIQRVNKHANEQLEILQRDYYIQRQRFDNNREDYLDGVKTARQEMSQEAFDNLKQVCKSLRCRIAELEYIKYEMEYPKIKPINPKGSGSSNATTIDEQRIINSQVPASENRNSTGNGSLQSIKKTPSDNNDQRNYEVENDFISPKDKCDVCFMIFSRSMDEKDRKKHKDEHKKFKHITGNDGSHDY